MPRYFSIPPIFSAPVSSINREAGIIYGVSICQVGLAKGHGQFVDKTFLMQIVDDAATKTAGIKARFGHPNMCSSALGTYLGRFKNYSYSGNSIKADLYLDETAKSTPNGNLFSYVLDMAEKNPDMFGASIAFTHSDSVFLEEEVNGQKVKNEYVRLQSLHATDIVDSPAATSGLFDTNSFPAVATQFLDENPEILDLVFSTPDSIKEFIANYITNTNMNISEKIKANFATFLASFSVPQSGSQAPDQEVRDQTLNTLFDAISVSFPDSFSDVENFTQEQKAEAITNCLSTLSTRLSDSVSAFDTLTVEHQELLAEMDNERQLLSDANATITTLKEQLSARPSIPLNVTDPALSTSNTTPDETGKQILAAMPKDMKRKLSSSSKTTE